MLAAAITSACAPVTRMGDGGSGRWLESLLPIEGGTRRYRLYVPSAWDGRRRLPLVVMLHGCTQNPEDFAAGSGMNESAEREGVLVAYPEQPATANARTCWNWFDAAHQHAGAGEPAIIASITRAVMVERNADPGRVYVAGLSAGGAMSAIMGVAYPELYAGVGIHSGVPFAAATSVADAPAAMQGKPSGPLAIPFRGSARPPALIVLHGESDAVVSPANAELIAQQWRAGGSDALRDSGTTQGYAWRRWRAHDGRVELWKVDGLGHAWSGGSTAGSFADPGGPRAADVMLQFFLAHPASESGG